MTHDELRMVLEAQTAGLVAKNEAIKDLERRLEEAKRQIDVLEKRVEAGLYQNIIDQIQIQAVEALDDALQDCEMEFSTAFMKDGDMVRTVDSHGSIIMAKLEQVEVSQYAEFESSALGRRVRREVEATTWDLIKKIRARGTKLVFMRQPNPIPGCGAISGAAFNKYGLRAIIAYESGTLKNKLYLTVLCASREWGAPSSCLRGL